MKIKASLNKESILYSEEDITDKYKMSCEITDIYIKSNADNELACKDKCIIQLNEVIKGIKSVIEVLSEEDK